MTALPRTLAANPRLSRWISIATDGTVTVRIGKVELGQGILTAIAQIAADELDVDLGQVRIATADTIDGPDEGPTAGSMSVADCGAAVRQVCAEVRAIVVARAVAVHGLDRASVAVHAGQLSDASGTTTCYAALAAIVDLDRDATGTASPKPVPAQRSVGTDVARLDLPDKLAGRPRYIADLVLPGLLFGRVVRPPSVAARLATTDAAAVEAMAGVVAVVCDGSFLGVVADSALAANRAAQRLREVSRWDERDSLPDEDDLAAFLRTGPSETSIVDETGAEAVPVVGELRATYSRPFLAHASMAPSCGVAQWDGTAVRVWSHSQDVFSLRRAIAQALHLDPSLVNVRHVENAGCYGHNGADDAAFDAVLLAGAVAGRPVQVLWSRRDELTWSPFGSAMVIDLSVAARPDGTVLSWTADIFSQGHIARPGYAGTPGLLAAAHLEQPHAFVAPIDPPAATGGGSSRNAVPIYSFGHRRIRTHRKLHAPLRSSAIRSLGAFLNVFAIESMMDELALAAGRDPVDYRLAQLTDPRAADVLRAAADLAGWSSRQPADSVGHGVGFARYKGSGAYCAVVAEVEAVHEVRVRRLAVAVDVGRVINPDGVRNQIEGGAAQATSWTLTERVRFDRRRVTSDDWESYPILRFGNVPRVDVELVSRPDLPSVGAGEAAQGPTAAAIANAVADALSVRVRDLPLTPERILSALAG